MVRWLDPEELDRLASDPARQMRPRPIKQIDFSRPFVPETYTQLYYAPIYMNLHREHRLRYNQLFAVRNNEYIMMLEADLVERLLGPLRRHRNVAGNAALVRCIDTMIAEEKRHYDCFLALNRVCFPDLFVADERYFSRPTPAMRAMFAIVGLLAGQLAFALWYLMAMEEASTAMARDMMRYPETETLGGLEPQFVAVHREHLKDEARHLHVDGLLIELCLDRCGRARRTINARLFKSMLGAITRPSRAGSGVRVIRELVRQMPELSSREEEMVRAVLALGRDQKFQESLFNRRAMPLTFGIFDANADFTDLSQSMVGYDRH